MSLSTSSENLFNKFNHRQRGLRSNLESFEQVSLEKTFHVFARAGFFLFSDTVQCCECGLAIENWLQIRDPLILHSLRSPQCGFLRRHFCDLDLYDLRESYQNNWEEDIFQCKICYMNTIDCVLSCRHTFCTYCLQRCQRCPLCATPLTCDLHYTL